MALYCNNIGLVMQGMWNVTRGRSMMGRPFFTITLTQIGRRVKGTRLFD